MAMRIDLKNIDDTVEIWPIENRFSWEERTHSVRLGTGRNAGALIGRVWKGTRTWSPPTHKGSRVVRFHKEVPCWYAEPVGEEAHMGRDRDFRTRREALEYLLQHYKETHV